METTSSEQQNTVTGQPQGFGEIKIDLLGFAFHPAWIYLLFYSNGTLGEILGHGASAHGAPYYLSMVPLALATLLGAVFTKRFMTFATRPAAAFGAPALTALGTLLYVADAVSPATAYLLGAGTLTGLGSALVAARWAALFGRFSTRAVMANLPLLLFLQVALCLSLSYLGKTAQVALLIMLPLAGGGCLILSERRAAEGLIGTGARHERDGAPFPLRTFGLFLLCIGAIGFISALLGACGNASEPFDYGAWFDIAVTALTLLFVGRALFLLMRPTLPALFLAPVGALLLVLLPQMRFSANFLADVVYPIGAIVFELLLLFAATVFARTQNCSPAKTYMAARLLYALSDIAGSVVGGATLARLDPFALAHGATIVLMGGIGLLVTVTVVLTFTSSSSLFASMRRTERAGETRGARAADAAHGNAGATAPGEGERFARPDAAAAEAPTPHEAIVARCEALGAQFGLSEREGQVLVLIAEGRSSARIQEDLSIAAGTVNYHTRNIYAKLGVHSRQEIIDMALGREGGENSGVDNRI